MTKTTAGDFDPSFNKYEGLFGKNGFINRLAETFGHEAGGHGLLALHDPAFAVYTQKLLNEVNPAVLAANRARTPLPPDLQEKVQQRDLVLNPVRTICSATRENHEWRTQSDSPVGGEQIHERV